MRVGAGGPKRLGRDAGVAELRVATANVNTLWPEEVRMYRRDGLGNLASEKVLRLEREFRSAG